MLQSLIQSWPTLDGTAGCRLSCVEGWVRVILQQPVQYVFPFSKTAILLLPTATHTHHVLLLQQCLASITGLGPAWHTTWATVKSLQRVQWVSKIVLLQISNWKPVLLQPYLPMPFSICSQSTSWSPEKLFLYNVSPLLWLPITLPCLRSSTSSANSSLSHINSVRAGICQATRTDTHK